LQSSQSHDLEAAPSLHPDLWLSKPLADQTIVPMNPIALFAAVGAFGVCLDQRYVDFPLNPVPAPDRRRLSLLLRLGLEDAEPLPAEFFCESSQISGRFVVYFSLQQKPWQGENAG
jgi:hypothetical protein